MIVCFSIVGHHYLVNESPDRDDIPELPHEIFYVKRNGYYRFRVINSGMMFAYRIAVDQVLLLVFFSVAIQFRQQQN